MALSRRRYRHRCLFSFNNLLLLLLFSYPRASGSKDSRGLKTKVKNITAGMASLRQCLPDRDSCF